MAKIADDYWFKIVGMLQQNWAVVASCTKGGCEIQFFNDLGEVFDSLSYDTQEEAKAALRRNGFTLYAEDIEAQKIIAKPTTPLHPGRHPNGNIYSSGQCWKV